MSDETAGTDEEGEALDDADLVEADLDDAPEPPSTPTGVLAAADVEAAHAEDETTAHRVLPPEQDDAPTGRLAEKAVCSLPSRARRRLESAVSQQAAELYDTVVVPHWISLFAAPLLAQVPQGFRGQILDASAGTGHLSLELLRRVDGAARIVALEPDTTLLDLLRRRTTGAAGRQIFARAEAPPELGFGDEVFDLVVAAAFRAIADRACVAELRRVMAPGARLSVSTPLRGTFDEVLDLFAEVAARRGGELPARVTALREQAPDSTLLATSLRRLGFDPVEVRVVERQLVFRSVRDLFTHPVIAHAALPEWRVAAGFERGGEDVLAELEQTFATYVPRGPVSLTVQLGVVEARRP
jgi:SAM-dependent methyltransferase